MSNFWKINKKFHGVKARTHWEYRLYYDDDGNVITYTTDNKPGKYIVVSQSIFAQNRYDIVVKNGLIHNLNRITEYRKLIPSEQGIETLVDDVTIIGTGQHWETKYYDRN